VPYAIKNGTFLSYVTYFITANKSLSSEAQNLSKTVADRDKTALSKSTGSKIWI